MSVLHDCSRLTYIPPCRSPAKSSILAAIKRFLKLYALRFRVKPKRIPDTNERLKPMRVRCIFFLSQSISVKYENKQIFLNYILHI